ncbi:hypothetical protein NAEGRDRAFT_78813 [Naegleria gruberi]|uniref:Zn(2)-C6 fungal-type domain-containing protein n=1 Tax=Naegleria gruberi TaxID=5762 RepID=D2V6Q2_NAEGR|nr:uncharacterized protein NAEGRDRAFT_78813 [Naegleria gruberi]EFC47618.1 hypothetical protein NAEGRDRAFT_78813 [Naegleria gruberi]|eukprot:XP_002680362.1 hypothetical protein NAEGRDRAFT_78813 [Naegleria gruberi strain NEG-M]
MPKSTSRGGSTNTLQQQQQSDDSEQSTTTTSPPDNDTNNTKNKRVVKTPYTKRACISCHKAKVKCSHERPCQRCITKHIESTATAATTTSTTQQQLALIPNHQFCPMILLPTTAGGVGAFNAAAMFHHHNLVMPTTTGAGSNPAALALQPTTTTSTSTGSSTNFVNGYPASSLAAASFNQIVDVTDSINNNHHTTTSLVTTPSSSSSNLLNNYHHYHQNNSGGADLMMMDGNVGDDSPFLSKHSPGLFFNEHSMNDDLFSTSPLPHHNSGHNSTGFNHRSIINDEGIDESIVASELVKDDEEINQADSTSLVDNSTAMELQPYKSNPSIHHNNNNDITHLGNLICMVLQRQDKQARDLKELKDDIIEIKKYLMPKGSNNNNGRKSSALRPID